ncbi:hypothetical protein SUGI_0473970 [Cryptomeria japonica]|nr:hypothetical protein SUGI_0473970 [Cryptomeria japonica]
MERVLHHLSSMDANFSLMASKPMVAFWGNISNERLSNIFKFDDKDFLTRVKIIYGDEYLKAWVKYRCNANVASMFVAWCFKLEEKEQCNGWLIAALERSSVSGFIPPLHPFLIWSANSNNEVQRASARVGMTRVKDYLKAMEAQNFWWELEKWGPYSEQSSPTTVASTSRCKWCRPRGSKKMSGRKLWIGFPLSDGVGSPQAIDGQKVPPSAKGKEIVVAE